MHEIKNHVLARLHFNQHGFLFPMSSILRIHDGCPQSSVASLQSIYNLLLNSPFGLSDHVIARWLQLSLHLQACPHAGRLASCEPSVTCLHLLSIVEVLGLKQKEAFGCGWETLIFSSGHGSTTAAVNRFILLFLWVREFPPYSCRSLRALRCVQRVCLAVDVKLCNSLWWFLESHSLTREEFKTAWPPIRNALFGMMWVCLSEHSRERFLGSFWEPSLWNIGQQLEFTNLIHVHFSFWKLIPKVFVMWFECKIL